MWRLAITELAIVLLFVPLTANAVEPIHGWKPLKGAVYSIHGGSLADRELATTGDRKLSIAIDGHSAREIFASLGSDSPANCSSDEADRTRSKEGVTCVYTAQDKSKKDGPYRCWIGIDLRTGRSIGTVSC